MKKASYLCCIRRTSFETLSSFYKRQIYFLQESFFSKCFIISFILSLHQRVTGLIVCRYFCRMLPFLYYLFPALYRLCTILANLASTITHRITTINLESK